MRTRILNSQFLIPNCIALVVCLCMAAACRDAPPASVQAQGAAAQAAVPSSSKADPGAGLKTLTLTRANTGKPVVGTEVHATADGLPPNRTVDLLWETVDGGWVVEDGYRFRGKRFVESTKVLVRATVGADGRLSARFTVPEDYGGVHAVIVADAGVPARPGRHRGHPDVRDAPVRGPDRHAHRAPRHWLRLADDGQYRGS